MLPPRAPARRPAAKTTVQPARSATPAKPQRNAVGRLILHRGRKITANSAAVATLRSRKSGASSC